MKKENTENLWVIQGSEFVHDFLYRDEATGDVVPLTGYTVRAQLRASTWSASPTYEFPADNTGISILDAANGVVRMAIPASVSAAWKFDRAQFDIEIVDALNRPTRLVKGTVFISREMTR